MVLFFPTLWLEHFVALAAHPRRFILSACSVFDVSMSNPRGLRTLRTHHHHIRSMDRCFLLDNASLGVLLGRSRMTLHHIDILNNKAIRFRKHLKNFSLFAERIAGNDENFVILMYM
jgi:hypothetical protein